MKKLLIILLTFLLCVSVANAYVYRNIGSNAHRFRSLTGAAALQDVTPSLGAVGLEIFAYGARDVGGSVNPNTPLEYRVQVAQKTAGSPPITNAYRPTIFLVVIYNDGSFDLYGTEDVPNIQGSNRFTYDPTLGRWVNTKGVSQGNVKGQQRFVGTVSFNGETKLIQKNLNVR